MKEGIPSYKEKDSESWIKYIRWVSFYLLKSRLSCVTNQSYLYNKSPKVVNKAESALLMVSPLVEWKREMVESSEMNKMSNLIIVMKIHLILPKTRMETIHS